MIDYEIFTRRWLRRAINQNRKLDKGDRFISLWIAFNGWLKNEYGENNSDRALIENVKSNTNLKKIFIELKFDILCSPLERLGQYLVLDMRAINDNSKAKKYDGTYETLMEILYMLRCNLFHGRKNIDDDKKDEELVHLAFDILLPLFNTYHSRFC